MSSPIADLSYRNYDGPILPIKNRWWAIARSTMLIAFKKKSMWLFMVGSAWYYIAMIFILFIVDQMVANAPPVPAGRPNPLDTFFSTIVWKDHFMHGFQFGQICYFAIALILGAGTIANDNRANALLVYLSKPISKKDYVLGKWMGIFLPLLITMLLPSLIFYLYGVMSFRDKGFVSQDPWLFVKVIAFMPFAAAFHSTLVLGISSLFNQGRMAGSVYAAVYFLTNFFTKIMGVAYFVITNERNRGGSEPPAAAVSAATNLFYGSVDGLCNGLFKAILKTNGGVPFGLQVQGGGTSVPYPSIWFVMPAILVLAAIFLLIAWRRVRAVNIIGG